MESPNIPQKTLKLTTSFDISKLQNIASEFYGEIASHTANRKKHNTIYIEFATIANKKEFLSAWRHYEKFAKEIKAKKVD